MRPEEFLEAKQLDATAIYNFLREVQERGVDEIYSPNSTFFKEIKENSLLTDDEILYKAPSIESPEQFKFFGHTIEIPNDPSGGKILKLILQLFEKLQDHLQHNSYHDLMGLILRESYYSTKTLNSEN